MKRLLLAGMIGTFGWLAAAGADAKVAVLISRSADPYMQALKGFQNSTSLDMETFNMEGNMEKGVNTLRGLSPEAYNLIVSIGTEAGLANKSVNLPIPLVYTMVMDPLDFPGKTAAGVVIKLGVGDQLQRISKVFPNRKRVGIVYNPQYSSKDIEQARAAAATHGLTLYTVAIEKNADMADALKKFNSTSVDIMWMPPDKTFVDQAIVQQLIQHSLAQNLPLVGFSVFQVKAGALAAFSVDFTDIGQQTGQLAARFKSDARSVVENPKKVIIFVNSKVQKQMGINDLTALPEVQFIQ